MIRSTRDLFDELVRRRPLLVKTMLVLSTAALLATSKHEDEPRTEEEEDDYFFWFELAGPMARVELTETKPNALVRINVRANALGKDRVLTTEGALINIAGVVTHTGTYPDGSTQAVSISIGTRPGGVPQVLFVYSSFSVTKPLEFTGDCEKFESTNPCVAETTIELARTIAGSGGGFQTVDVTPDFEMTAPKSEGPSEQALLPWTVEVTTE